MSANNLEIAIVGGGIVGLTTALGFINHTNASVRIYEQAGSYREIGAGIGFTPNAERAMHIVDSRVHAGFKQVATRNASDWFQYVDGFSEKGEDAPSTEQDLLFKLYLGKRGFEGCSRADFLEQLAALAPPGLVEFKKRLQTIEQNPDTERSVLQFADGTQAEADIVIGCDGIRSRVRQIVLGAESPSSYPGYSHKYAVRGLVPMEKAEAALGKHKTSTRFMHLGPDAHVLTFPVAGGALLNVVAFVTDPDPWPYQEMTAKVDRERVTEAFSRFGPTVHAIIGLLPADLDRWAVFDTYEYPAETYFRGGIVLAGDAAHAAAPHHGAGAGCGIEDAALLCSLMGSVSPERLEGNLRAATLRQLFEVYDMSRRGRTQWLVESSRLIGNVYEWQYPESGSDAAKCHDEAYRRSHLIWDYDVTEMVRLAQEELAERLGSLSSQALPSTSGAVPIRGIQQPQNGTTERDNVIATVNMFLTSLSGSSRSDSLARCRELIVAEGPAVLRSSGSDTIVQTDLMSIVNQWSERIKGFHIAGADTVHEECGTTEPEVWIEQQIAAVWMSTRLSVDSIPAILGMMLFCLQKTNEGWKIISIAGQEWESENGLPAPSDKAPWKPLMDDGYEAMNQRRWDNFLATYMTGGKAILHISPGPLQPTKTMILPFLDWVEFIKKGHDTQSTGSQPTGRTLEVQARIRGDIGFTWIPFVVEVDGKPVGKGVHTVSFMRQPDGKWLNSGFQALRESLSA